MIAETLLLALVSASILFASLLVLRSEADATIRAWTLGWVAFITTGILASLVVDEPTAMMRVPLFVAYVASSAAPVFFLWGVFALVRVRPPSWIIPVASVLVAGRAILGVMGDEVSAELLSLPVEVGAHVCAAALVLRWGRRHSMPHEQLALVATHVLMALSEGGMALVWIQGWDRGASKLFLSATTIALAGTQLVVVLRRSRQRADEAIEDRERDLRLLRDLAHLGTRHTVSRPLLDEAATLLREHLAVDWVGFWHWSDSRGRWVANTADEVPTDVADAVRLLALRVDDLASQPGGAKAPDAGDLFAGCEDLLEPERALLPLQWQGEVLGVMGVGLVEGYVLPPNVRSVLSTLAEELSLSLHHVLSVQQRDRAHVELLAERRKLAAVFETTPIGLLVTTAGGRIEMMNNTAANNAGCEQPDQLIGGSMTAFLDDLFTRIADPEAFVQGVAAATDESGTLRDLEVEVLRPDGPTTLLLFSSQVLDDRGEVTARIWASRDVSPERALSDQLRHAQKLETLGTLSGGIAHDFNNQLAVILGNVRFARDALGEEAARRDDVNEALDDLERAADHCAQLTRSLLSFARRAPVSLGHVGPNQVVHDLDELLRPLLPSSIDLRCEAEDDLPHIMADSAQLQQVLVNLALNARDAIAEGGEIRIRARVKDLGLEHVRRHGVGRPGRHLVFEVHDTGHGLEPETLDRIFEPFYTTKPIGKGTGLGLAIVHGVVTAHSGWLEVDSEPDRGTSFYIYLPSDEQTEPISSGNGIGNRDAISDAHDVIALSTAASQSERILVADDDDAVRKLLVRGLTAQGFEVVGAVDGDDALKRFTESADGFDAVVLDWNMPGLEGPEAARRILEIDPGVPILVATGYGEIETGLDLEIIAKPFDVASLATRIRERIEAPRR